MNLPATIDLIIILLIIGGIGYILYLLFSSGGTDASGNCTSIFCDLNSIVNGIYGTLFGN
jgi:hypothetical protein